MVMNRTNALAVSIQAVSPGFGAVLAASPAVWAAAGMATTDNNPAQAARRCSIAKSPKNGDKAAALMQPQRIGLCALRRHVLLPKLTGAVSYCGAANPAATDSYRLSRTRRQPPRAEPATVAPPP